MESAAQDNSSNTSNLKEGKEVVIVEGQLRKIIHQQGEGDHPKKGDEVFALYRGTLETGEEFDSNQDRQNPFNFPVGEGRVIKGWDEGFVTMKRGQKATLICSPDYAYGKRGSPPRIPPNATLHFEVELIDFKEKKKEKWDMSDEEKVEEAIKAKNKGNSSFKAQNFAEAIKDYSEGVEYVEGQTAEACKAILKTLRLNLAQAQIKAKKFSGAVDNCTKVLAEDPQNVKALYRRGVAYLQSQQFDKSQSDLEELLKIEPANADAKNGLQALKKAAHAFKQKQKKVFGGMFSKGNIYEDVPVKKEPVVEVKETEDADVPEGEPTDNKVYLEEMDAN